MEWLQTILFCLWLCFKTGFSGMKNTSRHVTCLLTLNIIHLKKILSHVGKYTAHISALSCYMPPSFNNLLKLECNNCAMVWWIYNVCTKYCISSDSLMKKLGINNIKILQYDRLRWFGHVPRNDDCINKITVLDVDGHGG